MDIFQYLCGEKWWKTTEICKIMKEFKRQHYVNQLIMRKCNDMIKIITGLRRSGKSYLLNTLFVNHLLEQGVSADCILQIDLEDAKNKPLRDPMVMLQYIEERSNDNRQYYVILDEVQLMSEFEEILNTLLKRRKYDVYVTGSNSRFLVTDVITEFRGRGDEIRIYPLSVAELHEAFPEKSWIDLWREYSLYGGLPQVVLMTDEAQKTKYLKQLFRTTYLKDILDRYRIQQVEEFGQLIDFVASAIGSLTNPLKLANTFVTKGFKLDSRTVNQYLGYLLDSFLISEAKRYDIRGKQYIGSPCKYYFTDIGLRNARLNFRQTEETHLMENIIYTELLRRDCAVDVGVVEVEEQVEGKRQHKRLEVDFVCNNGYKRCYIQSAYSMPSYDKIQQELQSLMRINDNFLKVIITADMTPTHQMENGVLILNLMDFLTKENSLPL